MSPLLLVDSRILALFYAVFIYAAMLCIANILVKGGQVRELTSSQKGRVGALDGFRGILALGVFVHHSVTSYVWATTGIWDWGPNAVLNQLGQTTVALFFMITGFLFTRKTMTGSFDWRRFYTGRLVRLAPLYFLLVFVVFAVVFAASGGRLNESVLRLGSELLRWLAFVCFGRPDINAYPGTWIVIAGVNWTLQYEAIFYVVAVPALFMFNRRFSLPTAFAISFVALVLLAVVGHFRGGRWLFEQHFLAGIVMAYAYSLPRSRAMLETQLLRWLGALAACAFFWLPNSNSATALICAIIVFAAVVGDASVFGLLKSRAGIWLGDISYGVYLLHGLILWLAYRVVAVSFTLPGFILFAFVVATLAVTIASVSYTRFELPMMARFRGPKSNEQPA